MSTALTPRSVPALRPVPWHRLGWVAWRRYRPAVVTTAALLGLVALYVLIRGSQMRHAYAAVQGCTPQTAANCEFAADQFHDTYGSVGLVGGIVVFVPGLIGAFAGAPLLARELETGTFRYVWTQGVGRMRWLIALLVAGTLGAVAIGAALGALVTWYNQPLVDSGFLQRQQPSIFPVTGIAVAGWALLGYSIGVASGALIRRVLPALATTLIIWSGVAFAASYAREHDYEAPLVSRRPRIADHDLQIQQWWTHGGARADRAELNHVLQAIGAPTGAGGDVVIKPGGPGIDPVNYLLQHGYTEWTSYQPDSRYWTFQTIELAWLVTVSLLLLAATLWLVRRRGA
jgi:ABC-2 family transporter protein